MVLKLIIIEGLFQYTFVICQVKDWRKHYWLILLEMKMAAIMQKAIAENIGEQNTASSAIFVDNNMLVPFDGKLQLFLLILCVEKGEMSYLNPWQHSCWIKRALTSQKPWQTKFHSTFYRGTPLPTFGPHITVIFLFTTIMDLRAI